MPNKKMIYLDYNANAPIFDSVKCEVVKNLDRYGNASAIHSVGKVLDDSIESSRILILNYFKAVDCKLIFTSSGTESNNIILKNILDIDCFITSPTEHISILNVRNDFSFIPIDRNGIVKIEELEKKLKKLKNKKFLLSVMLVNNENGIIQPIKTISKLVHKYGGLIHCDVAQAIGKIDINFKELDLDAISLSSHKFGGPIGISGLIVKNKIKISNFLAGGEQEYSIRSGSSNHLLIPAFAKALEFTKSEKYINKMKLVLSWQDWFEDKLKKVAPNILIFGEKVSRLTNVTHFCIPDVQSENIIFSMDIDDIIISSGSSCSSKVKKESYVVRSMKYSKKIATNSVRVSWGWKSRKDELSIFIDKLKYITESYNIKAA